MTIWQKICSALSDAGIRVFAPGRHIGVCESPYCVIQQDGSYALGGSGNEYTNYMVHAYVPMGSYLSLSMLLEEVRYALAELLDERVIYFTGYESPHLIDDDYSAHTAYLEYRAYSSDN